MPPLGLTFFCPAAAMCGHEPASGEPDHRNARTPTLPIADAGPVFAGAVRWACASRSRARLTPRAQEFAYRVAKHARSALESGVTFPFDAHSATAQPETPARVVRVEQHTQCGYDVSLQLESPARRTDRLKN